jgi:thioredoxin reductase (NADPH)
MVRSIFLRGFDQDMANRIGTFMENHKTKFIRGATPSKMEKLDGEDGQISVTFKQGEEEKVEKYDTVLFAMGRYAVTGGINLAAAGVTCEPNGKFKVNDEEQTNIPHIYAIGDVIYGQLELTPVAIKAGMLLSKRLFAGATAKMDYLNVPTTVFTPLEYGCCGYDEEAAKTQFGAENILTYHQEFQPLEW